MLASRVGRRNTVFTRYKTDLLLWFRQLRGATRVADFPSVTTKMLAVTAETQGTHRWCKWVHTRPAEDINVETLAFYAAIKKPGAFSALPAAPYWTFQKINLPTTAIDRALLANTDFGLLKLASPGVK